MTTEPTDRRTRSRDIPYACKLRLCVVPKDSITCPECGRPVFRANFVVEKGGL